MVFWNAGFAGVDVIVAVYRRISVLLCSISDSPASYKMMAIGFGSNAPVIILTAAYCVLDLKCSFVAKL